MAQGYIWASPLAKAMLGGVMAASATVGAGVAEAQAVRTASVTVPTPRAAQVRQAPAGAADVTMEAATRMAEEYFNGLSTFQAEFSQSVTGEAFASEGTFYLKKPRQFVWQYDTPTRQKIVGTGTAVYYVDQSGPKGSGQVTQLPMDAGLNRLFGAKALKLNGGGLRVSGVASSPSELTLTLQVEKSARADQAGLKTVKLTFTRKPDRSLMAIMAIEATDVTGVVTRVSFSDIKTGVPLAAKLFEFTPGVYKSAN